MKRRLAISLLLLIEIFLSQCNRAKKIELDLSKPLGALASGDFFGDHVPRVGAEIIAVGSNCSSFSSIDGKGWTGHEGSTTLFSECNTGAVLYDIKFGNGLWVAVGGDSAPSSIAGEGCGIWTSPDGLTWTRRSCPRNESGGVSTLKSISVGNENGKTRFWAVGRSYLQSERNYTYLIYSNDGVTWFHQQAFESNSYPSCNLHFYKDHFYCMDGNYSRIHRSLSFSDTHWSGSLISTPGSFYENSIENLGFLKTDPSGRLLAFGNADPDRAHTINAGISIFNESDSSWTTHFSNIESAQFGVALSPERFVIASQNCRIDYSEDGGNTWVGGPSQRMSFCTTYPSHWTHLEYHEYLKLFVTLGFRETADGGPGLSTLFSISDSGLPEDWTIADSWFSEASTEVKSIGVKPL
ncbi:hypothetical protein CH373_02040 [Leptospira perolatii]|uniref:Exo-alpha-sialidase n=1 Tax=Leptospira perolatii TaxID=2023191 RepID=A0A2M9ZS93_9LEPT|nr:hypothetical protein [Leptospira perolatii]PJZ71307.1 hypothetical protein CH360_02040 [Leptospira perolatii]PJZ74841.1 hypothetical protein CH373_02040 [Leptospira perolatii]